MSHLFWLVTSQIPTAQLTLATLSLQRLTVHQPCLQRLTVRQPCLQRLTVRQCVIPAKGPRLVLFADTHGLTGYEPNLTNNPIWNLDGQSTLSGAQVGHGPITSNPPWRSAQNFAEETPGICWQSNMFTGESKAETFGTFNKLATKEQLKNTSRELVMKFTLLQLYGPRKSVWSGNAGNYGCSRTKDKRHWICPQVFLLDETHNAAGNASETQR